MGEVSWGMGEGPLIFNFKTDFSWGLPVGTWEGYKNSDVLKTLS